MEWEKGNNVTVVRYLKKKAYLLLSSSKISKNMHKDSYKVALTLIKCDTYFNIKRKNDLLCLGQV